MSSRSRSRLEFDGLILDLDGVVWLGDDAVPRAADAVGRLRAAGISVVFVTNDPRGSRDDYAARLAMHGIPADPDEIVTAASTLAAVVADREGAAARTLAIGSPALETELADAGLQLVREPDEADVVAAGGYDDFDYGELRRGTLALRRGAALYAAGRDATFPMPDGPWPGTGAIVAALEVAGGKHALAVGKPEGFMFEIARSRLRGCRDVAIVGDNLHSDISGGARAGFQTVLVLTGTHRRADVATADVKPDLVFADLAAVASARCGSPLSSRESHGSDGRRT